VTACHAAALSADTAWMQDFGCGLYFFEMREVPSTCSIAARARTGQRITPAKDFTPRVS
jgi:hypothetical protein